MQEAEWNKNFSEFSNTDLFLESFNKTYFRGVSKNEFKIIDIHVLINKILKL